MCCRFYWSGLLRGRLRRGRLRRCRSARHIFRDWNLHHFSTVRTAAFLSRGRDRCSHEHSARWAIEFDRRVADDCSRFVFPFRCDLFSAVGVRARTATRVGRTRSRRHGNGHERAALRALALLPRAGVRRADQLAATLTVKFDRHRPTRPLQFPPFHVRASNPLRSQTKLARDGSRITRRVSDWYFRWTVNHRETRWVQPIAVVEVWYEPRHTRAHRSFPHQPKPRKRSRSLLLPDQTFGKDSHITPLLARFEKDRQGGFAAFSFHDGGFRANPVGTVFFPTLGMSRVCHLAAKNPSILVAGDQQQAAKIAEAGFDIRPRVFRVTN